MDKIDAELIAAGIDPARLVKDTSVLVRVIKEKYDLQAKLDRVTELVEKWIPPLEHLQRSIDDGTYGTTNVPGACAKALKQALKEGVK